MAEVTSLFYPEAQLELGGYILTKGIKIEAYSAKDTYYDWAKVQILKELEELVTINKLDKAELMLGYDGNLQSVFQGYVYKPVSNSGTERELLLKDDMLKLETTKITQTFMDVTPDEIVKYCLALANITEYKLFKNNYPKRKVVPIVQKSIIQVFEEVKKLWNIKDLFYFAKGVFYFGQKHIQEKIYTFEYGNNIISLNKENNLWVLETAQVPFIRHSDVINLDHPKIEGEQEVKKIVFSNGSGFMRTRIYF